MEARLTAVRTLVNFLNHWAKELFIATVLAIVAAVGVEVYKVKRAHEVLSRNVSAVAVVLAYKDRDHAPFQQGSGVFINDAGLLVTNYHVIDGADRLVAKLSSGARYELLEIKGSDSKADIAILQFDGRGTPSVRGLGDSDAIEAGDRVLAIGAPRGLEGSVSEGIVSNPKRSFDGLDLIQFTAPISQGSSGGGLFDSENGFLLGLTSASLTARSELNQEIAQNLNFAVPINLVRNSIDGADKGLTEQSSDYYYSLGHIAESKHEWDGAIANYLQAVKLDGKYAPAYLGLGGAYYEKGEYDQEVASYEKAVALDPANYDAQYWLGTAYEDQAQYEKAIERYKVALALKPDLKDALHDMILLSLVQGSRANASALIPRLKQLDAGVSHKLEMLLKHLR